MLKVSVPYVFTSFSNFILLERNSSSVSVPYVFTSFSNSVLVTVGSVVVSVPYVFTSFSNPHLHIDYVPVVSVPYVFTSFSNGICSGLHKDGFQYHTFLHHSQTGQLYTKVRKLFQYHTFLHHSQTYLPVCMLLFGFSTIRFYIILKPILALIT